MPSLGGRRGTADKDKSLYNIRDLPPLVTPGYGYIPVTVENDLIVARASRCKSYLDVRKVSPPGGEILTTPSFTPGLG